MQSRSLNDTPCPIPRARRFTELRMRGRRRQREGGNAKAAGVAFERAVQRAGGASIAW